MEIKSHLFEIMQVCFLQSILFLLYLSVMPKTNFLNNNKNNNKKKKKKKKRKKERKNSWFSYALSQLYTMFVRKLFLHVSFIYVFII